MALDEPNDNDNVMEINEIKVAVQSSIYEFTQDLELDFDQKWQRFYLTGLDSC